MKKPMTANWITVPAIAIAVAALMAGPARAEYRCDLPSTQLDKRVCALAQKGPGDLRHFIERTRMIYGLYFFDYAGREHPFAVQEVDPTRADALAVAATVAVAEPARQ